MTMDVVSCILLVLTMLLILPVFAIQAVECRRRVAWLYYAADLVVMGFAAAQLL